MKRKTIIALIALASTSTILIQSCKKDGTPATPAVPEEYIADNNSFSDFMNWPLDTTFNGPDPLLGAMAHANNDSTVIRDVHFKNGQNPVNNQYPIGTLVLKHSHNPAGTVNEFTAMAKRGNNFNPNVGDWEFFMLTPTGAIATDTSGMPMRGANLMNGMCAGCHSGASNRDFVFSK